LQNDASKHSLWRNASSLGTNSSNNTDKKGRVQHLHQPSKSQIAVATALAAALAAAEAKVFLTLKSGINLKMVPQILRDLLS
jgi:hypothetical protein